MCPNFYLTVVGRVWDWGRFFLGQNENLRLLGSHFLAMVIAVLEIEIDCAFSYCRVTSYRPRLGYLCAVPASALGQLILTSNGLDLTLAINGLDL